mmetsp:Transcript_61235/g.144520  ORF Transcript_61235/g.144520 Transcript_61235/m.144520 type:complete len:219 (-) Transcript_61235:42-698(-)
MALLCFAVKGGASVNVMYLKSSVSFTSSGDAISCAAAHSSNAGATSGSEKAPNSFSPLTGGCAGALIEAKSKSPGGPCASGCCLIGGGGTVTIVGCGGRGQFFPPRTGVCWITFFRTGTSSSSSSACGCSGTGTGTGFGTSTGTGGGGGFSAGAGGTVVAGLFGVSFGDGFVGGLFGVSLIGLSGVTGGAGLAAVGGATSPFLLAPQPMALGGRLLRG